MTEASVGWRKWRVDADDGLLRSLFKETVWVPRERHVAKCLFRSGMLVQAGRQCVHAPSAGCTCGIYSVTREDELGRVGGRKLGTVASEHVRTTVYGRVSQWGRMIEHENGARSQFAYPYDLFVIPPMHSPSEADLAQEVAHRIAHKLREHYLVDTTVAM